MGSPIRNVTVAGITGALGIPIITALHAAGFNVQALTRKRLPSQSLPAKIVEVDYTSPEQLTSVLQGQDAVVSCLGDRLPAVVAQKALIEASLVSGVRRFIPSEFGSDTTNERVRAFPFFKAKLQHQGLLKQAAKENTEFSYSILITGPFLDWGLSVVPFIINVGSMSGEVWDSGTTPFSTTRTPTIGRAVSSILLKPTETANRILFIHEAVITQNQLIRHAVCQSHRSFSPKTVSTPEVEAKAWRAFADPTADQLDWVVPFVNLSIWSNERLCCFGETDNELLEVRNLVGEDMETVVAEEVGRARNVLCPGLEAAMEAVMEQVGKVGEVVAERELEVNVELSVSIAERAYEEGRSKLVLF